MKIGYSAAGLVRIHSSAVVLNDENPRTALIEGVIQDIAVNIEVTAGGLTLHLAAWQDPDHWSEDWQEALALIGEDPENVEGFIAGLPEPWTP